MSDIESEIKKQSELRPAIEVNVKKPAEYDKHLSEKVIDADVNTHIILGGKTHNTPDIAKAAFTSNITLVSGMGTAIKNSPPFLESGKLSLSPKYYYDSAVIQISEQTDVDSNFGARIKDVTTYNRSAIALKADEVRLFSRGTVKIITGIDQADKLIPDDPNKTNPPSHSKRDLNANGIHLIANNSAENIGELQPLVLGNNLVEFLNEVLNEINKIYAVIEQVCEKQSFINEVIKEHTHLSNFIPEPLLPLTDPKLVSKITLYNEEMKQLVNINNSTSRVPNVETLRNNYLKQNPVFYINSYYNKTN
jgi:hypothetical protein